MNKIVHLSLARKEVPIRIDVVKGATTPGIDFVLDDYLPENGATARIYIKKKESEVYNNCDISDNIITFIPTTTSFDEVGECKAQLQIIEGDDVAISFKMWVDVEENLIDGSAIESSNEYGALIDMTNDINVLKSEVAQIISGASPVDPDAELVDIRIAYDGTTYQTAGDAVRTQVQDVQNEINEIEGTSYNVIKTKWRNATITEGEYSEITTGLRFFASPDYFNLEGNTEIIVSGENSTDSVLYVHFYDENDSFISRQNTNFSTLTNGWLVSAPTGATKFRIHGYCRVATMPWVDMIPENFMVTLGNAVKPFISPTILNEDMGIEYMKKYGDIELTWVNTDSIRSRYSEYLVATPVNKKIFAYADSIVVTFPPTFKASITTYADEYDAITDYESDTDWQRSPLILNGLSGKWLRVVVRYAQAYTPIKPTDVQDVMAYFVSTDATSFASMEQLFNNSVEMSYVEGSKIYKSIAHRGIPTVAPECTAPSYILARQRGFDVAENDLFISSDGEYVMWHDPTLSKLGEMYDINGYEMYVDDSTFIWKDTATDLYYTFNGQEYVAYTPSGTPTRCTGANYSVQTLTFETLKRIDFGRWKGGEFIGTQILTFDEWVFLCKRLGMDLYVDRKITYTSEILQDVVDILNKYGMLKRASFIGGLTPTTIHLLLDIVPDAKFGVLAFPTPTNIANFEAQGAGDNIFWNPNGKELTAENKEIIRNAIAQGYDVEMWYVDYTNSKAELFEIFRDACEYGINGITTDFYRMDEALMDNISEIM